MDNPLDSQEETPDLKFNMSAAQARERLETARTFIMTEAYLDFKEEFGSIVLGADAVIDAAPESFQNFVNREQAIGERRIAKQAIEYFDDYIKTMRVLLDQINAATVAESEPENPETAQDQQ